MTIKQVIQNAVNADLTPTKFCAHFEQYAQTLIEGAELAELAAKNTPKSDTAQIGAVAIGEKLGLNDYSGAASEVFDRLTPKQREKYSDGGLKFASLFVSALFRYPNE